MALRLVQTTLDDAQGMVVFRPQQKIDNWMVYYCITVFKWIHRCRCREVYTDNLRD